MTTSKPPKEVAVEGLRFEDAARELESIIARIEGGEIELEESLKAYQRGLALVKRCNAILAEAEKAMESCSVDDLETAAKKST
jgi:exodeoxyribonuclease VII small subunit